MDLDSDEALGSGALLAGKHVLFLGAGEAGTGIGELISYCVHRRTGCSMQVLCSACVHVYVYVCVYVCVHIFVSSSAYVCVYMCAWVSANHF